MGESVTKRTDADESHAINRMDYYTVSLALGKVTSLKRATRQKFVAQKFHTTYLPA